MAKIKNGGATPPIVETPIVENVVETPKTDDVKTDDVKTDDKPIVETPKPLNEQLIDLRNERKQLSAKQNVDGITDDDFDKLENERFEITKKIKLVETQIENEANRLKHENELNDYISGLINPFIKSVIAYNELQSHNLINPDGSTTDEHKQTVADYNDVYSKLKNELTDKFNNVKRTIHVPMGTTGKQLESTLTTKTPNETSKNSQLKKLMGDGLTNEQLIKMGYLDGTVRYARWEYNKTLKQNGK